MRVVKTGDRQREALDAIFDGVQQRLVAVRIRFASPPSWPPGDVRLREVLSEFGDGLDEAIDELREVACGVHPQVLTDHGLVAALEHVARAGRSCCRHQHRAHSSPGRLELAILYCCREAIQNASKHGGPPCGSLSRSPDADGVHFEVSDDGPGFDVAKEAAGGRGLHHMRDRIALLGGRLSIASQAGVGTVVSGSISPIRIPAFAFAWKRQPRDLTNTPE